MFNHSTRRVSRSLALRSREGPAGHYDTHVYSKDHRPDLEAGRVRTDGVPRRRRAVGEQNLGRNAPIARFSTTGPSFTVDLCASPTPRYSLPIVALQQRQCAQLTPWAYHPDSGHPQARLSGNTPSAAGGHWQALPTRRVSPLELAIWHAPALVCDLLCGRDARLQQA